MDNCCEQNVEKIRTKGDTAKIAAILIFSALFAAACVFFAVLTGVFLSILPAIGITALGVWMTGFMTVEYEYILTNNEMDIDKIIGRRTRKRLITVDVSKTTEFAGYPPAGEVDRDVTVHATSGLSQDAHYLLTEHSDYGKVMVIFNPNEKMRAAMLQEFPSVLRSKMKREVD